MLREHFCKFGKKYSLNTRDYILGYKKSQKAFVDANSKMVPYERGKVTARFPVILYLCLVKFQLNDVISNYVCLFQFTHNDLIRMTKEFKIDQKIFCPFFS